MGCERQRENESEPGSISVYSPEFGEARLFGNDFYEFASYTERINSKTARQLAGGRAGAPQHHREMFPGAGDLASPPHRMKLLWRLRL